MQIQILMGMLFSVSILQSQVPNWTVNSADYSLDASIIGVLKIDNIVSTDTNDIVAVFDESGIVRGVANVSFNTVLNKHLIFITTLSNTNGDALTFKVYDASEDKVLESTTAAINFSPNEVLGDADTPFEIKADAALSVNSFEKNNIAVYPNPVENNLFILAKENIKSVKIYTVLGKKVINLKIDNTKIELEMAALKKGIYLLKAITTSNKNITKKIVKL